MSYITLMVRYVFTFEAHFVFDEPSVQRPIARLPRLRQEHPKSIRVAVVAEILPHELVDQQVFIGEWGGQQPVLRPFQGVEHLRSHLPFLRHIVNVRTGVARTAIEMQWVSCLRVTCRFCCTQKDVREKVASSTLR